MKGTGDGFIVAGRLSRYIHDIGMIVRIWVLFFIALVVFAFVVSREERQKEQGALLDSVREVKKRPYETGDKQKIYCEMQKQGIIRK